MSKPKANDMTQMMQALIEAQKQTAQALQQIDRRMTAVLTTPDREFVDRGQTAPRSSAPPQLDLAERILQLIEKSPQETNALAEKLNTTRSAVWAAIARLEQRNDAIVVSTPGSTRGRRGPSVVYHPSSPELAAKLRH